MARKTTAPLADGETLDEAGPNDPLAAGAPSTPAGAIYGPAGHIGYEQMRGGRTFRYRKNHDPWPEGQE